LPPERSFFASGSSASAADPVAYGRGMRVDIGDGVRLFVDVDGLGLEPDGPTMVERPTVVLLHGGPGADHSRFKSDPWTALSDLAQVVYYDHRGNGRSDPGAREDWTLDVWADDVVRLCDALGIERPIVIGSSFGGFVAQRYLARHPDHPDRVVLACTSPRLDVDLVAAAFERVGGEQAASAARDFWTRGPKAILGYLEHCMPLYSVEPLDTDAMARTVMNVDVLGHFQAGEQATMDLAPGLAATTRPVLVLAGELDPVCPVEMSEEIVVALSRAEVTFERFADASHDDVDQRAAAVVRSFITA
jgi:pimeloyl-ACP methyl ester carboxylesterase